MKKIYAGTSGRAYTTGKPDFYPAKLSSAKFQNYSNALKSLNRKVLYLAQKGEVFVYFKHEELRKALSTGKNSCKQSILNADEPV